MPDIQLFFFKYSLLLCDILKYQYTNMWRKTGLFPTFFLTGRGAFALYTHPLNLLYFFSTVSFLLFFCIFSNTAASLAMSSFLLNTRDPRRKTKNILLEFIPPEIENVLSQTLVGGFVSNNALFRFFSNSLHANRNFSTGYYYDANSL